jgi:hypothetical protein
MIELVFFLEEPSARELLNGLLPRCLPATTTYRLVVFEGKQDLEKRLGMRLRAWQNAQARFVVLRDKDSGNCVQIKSRLVGICQQSGQPDALVRIACHELESWYLGDLRAVEVGLEVSGLAGRQGSAKFRTPDHLANPVQELKRLAPTYQKVAGSRAIGRHLSLEENRSHSFNVFLSGIQRIVETHAS